MSTMNFKNSDELFRVAAEQFFKLGKLALDNKSFFDVALAGGSTAQQFFSYLLKGDQSILRKTRWFFSDERVVTIESEHSNAGQAWRHLLRPLAINRDYFFPPYHKEESAKEAAQRYEGLLKTLIPSNSQGIPIFDLVYLGLGLDAHTASLFPHSDLVKNSEAEKAMIAVHRDGKLEHERMTMMPKIILAAKEICLMTTGEAKAHLIEEVSTAPFQPEQWPVQLILKNREKGLTILTCA